MGDISAAAKLLCRYQYDALDRLAASTPLAEATVQRVYQKNRLSVEIQGALHRRVMQFDDHVLAEQRAAETVLPATDLQRSVLHSVDAQGQQGIAYSPYGHRPSASDVFSLLGFAGERPDPVTGHYPLGNGYRSYNPVLMRFNQPDSLSPFGEGGLNAYAYCQGDPVNRSDPTGHMWNSLMTAFGLRTRPRQSINPTGVPVVGVEARRLDLTPHSAMNSLSDQEVLDIGSLNRQRPSWQRDSQSIASPQERAYLDSLDDYTLRTTGRQVLEARLNTAKTDLANAHARRRELTAPDPSTQRFDPALRRKAEASVAVHRSRVGAIDQMLKNIPPLRRTKCPLRTISKGGSEIPSEDLSR
ncbi:RHS repeat-associated core domain-containing protein [Pseudomonas sp. S2_H01]